MPHIRLAVLPPSPPEGKCTTMALSFSGAPPLPLHRAGYYGTRYGNAPTPATGSSTSAVPAAPAAAEPALVGARDPRLGLLRRSWFEGKKCLDVGCNEGHLTIAIVRSFRPRRMVGIDIDSYLVQLAKRVSDAWYAYHNVGTRGVGGVRFRVI